MSRPFLKMNGLGNDFVVVETGAAPFDPGEDQVRAWANRENGVGFDQLIAISAGKAASLWPGSGTPTARKWAPAATARAASAGC